MTPEELAAYFDDVPEHAQSMCNLLMGAHPGWRVWHEPGIWKARRETPDGYAEEVNAGLLNRSMYKLDGIKQP